MKSTLTVQLSFVTSAATQPRCVGNRMSALR